MHPYLTERIFARSPHLSPLAVLGGMHHERTDGSGYPRGLESAAMPASPLVEIPSHASRGRPMLRGLIGLLLTAGICTAAFAWHSHGETIRLLDYAGKPILVVGK